MTNRTNSNEEAVMKIEVKLTDEIGADGKPEATKSKLRILAPANAEVSVNSNDEVVVVIEPKD